MATEPKIVRAYRKALKVHNIDLVDWHYTTSKNAHIRVVLQRGAAIAYQTINHSDSEVTRTMVATGKRAFNRASQ